MDYDLKLVTAPKSEPLTLAEVKVDRGMDAEDKAFDATLGLLIPAARRRAERITSRCLIDQTWDLRFANGFLSTERHYIQSPSEIRIPRSPLKATGGITHVKYLDSNGAQQDFAAGAAGYVVGVSDEYSFIVPAYGISWPTTRNWINASGNWSVEVRFIAGYGPAASAVPEDIRKAMLVMIGSWHEVREEITDADALPIPTAALAILSEYRFSPR